MISANAACARAPVVQFWRMSTYALKVLASPFEHIAFCGAHRSSSLARLLTSPDYPKSIRIKPASDPFAAAVVMEPPRNLSACSSVARCRRARAAAEKARKAGLAPDGSIPRTDGLLAGDAIFGDLPVSSWLMAVK